MDMFSSEELRVLGALVEKEITTPDYYPLSLNALVNACNQKNNREPVVTFGEPQVEEAIQSLKRRGLALEIQQAGSRVRKYGHRMGETWNLGRREIALLCVLMLRGPQTLGELRDRTGRMYEFADLEEVERCLEKLRATTVPMVTQLERQPGMKEPRYGHLFQGEPQMPIAQDVGSRANDENWTSVQNQMNDLQFQIAQLRDELAQLKQQLGA
jgi:uncharacterized protein